MSVLHPDVVELEAAGLGWGRKEDVVQLSEEDKHRVMQDLFSDGDFRSVTVAVRGIKDTLRLEGAVLKCQVRKALKRALVQVDPREAVNYAQFLAATQHVPAGWLHKLGLLFSRQSALLIQREELIKSERATKDEFWMKAVMNAYFERDSMTLADDEGFASAQSSAAPAQRTQPASSSSPADGGAKPTKEGASRHSASGGVGSKYSLLRRVLGFFVVHNLADIDVLVLVDAIPLMSRLSGLSVGAGASQASLNVSFEQIMAARREAWMALAPGRRASYFLDGGYVTVVARQNPTQAFFVQYWVVHGWKVMVRGTPQLRIPTGLQPRLTYDAAEQPAAATPAATDS